MASRHRCRGRKRFSGSSATRFLPSEPPHLSAGLLGNTFQTEVAVANLSIASLGILSYWFRGTFWIAAVIGKSVWELGDAVVHIQQMLTANNYSPNNAGVALYADILTPVILLTLLVYYQRAGRREHRRTAAGQPL